MEHDLDKGQHFMVDKILLQRIIEVAEITEKDYLLEVGSGEGALTEYLVKTPAKKLICVEQDARLPSPFEKYSSFSGETKYVQDNILKIIPSLNFSKVVANIPYHVSEPLFREFTFSRPKKIVCVVGKKFSEVLLGKTILGGVLQSIYDIEEVQEIPPSAFSPPPDVLSALVVLTLKNKTLLSKSDKIIAKFYKFNKSKVKNFVINVTQEMFTKKEIKEKLAFLHGALLDKELYSLTNEEFMKIKEYIEFLCSEFVHVR